MSDEDVQYFRKRAAEERALASQSAGKHIAEIHLDLARQYEALADERALRPRLHLNWSGQAGS
jgi:hypothetical protein